MAKLSTVRFKDSIASRLLHAVFLVYIVSAIAISAVQMYAEYAYEKKALNEELLSFEKSFGGAVAEAVWDMDLKELRAILNGMVAVPSIAGVKVTSPDDKSEVVATAGTVLKEGADVKAAGMYVHEFEVVYNHEIGSEHVGTLSVFSDKSLVWQKVRFEFYLILASFIVQLLSIWIIFRGLGSVILSKPLAELTSVAERVKIDNLEKLKVNVTTKGRNELRILEETFNTMLMKLHEDVVEQARIQSELKAYQNNLEEIVQQRTDELEKANNELSLSQKLAEQASKAKSEFIANMSHEIRTPMNAVLGFAELLATKEADPKKSHYIECILTGGHSLLELINEILDLSKIEAGKLEIQVAPFSLEELLRDIQRIFAGKISKKGLDFVVDIQKGLPELLLLDKSRLRQVIVNLLGNAIKFTNKGRISLIVKFENVEQDSKHYIRLFIEVADTGIGIPDEQIERIFGAFEQVEGQEVAKYGGTGLGLTISRRLLDLMHGKIDVESGVGVGARFQIVFPKVEVP